MRFDKDAEDNKNVKMEWSVLKKFLPRFKPHRVALFICAFFMILYSFLSLAGPLLIRHAIDVNFVEKDLFGLLITSALFLLVILLSFGINYFQRVKLEIIGQEIIKGIRIDIFTHLLKMPQSFFDKHPVGQLLSRVESDTESVRQMFTFTIVVIITDLLKIAGIFFIMLSINPPLTFVLFSLSPVIVFTVFYFNGKIIPIYVEVRKRTADVYAFLEEYLRGSTIIQAFTQENRVIDKMDLVNKSKLDVEYPGKIYSCYFGYFIFFLSIAATSLVLGVGGIWAMKSPETLTIGTLVAFLSYIDHFFGPIFHLSEQLNVIQRAFAGAKRINDIMEKPVAGYSKEGTEYEFPVQGDKKDGLEFRDVWFAYKDEDWVLKDVSFSLGKGKRLAIAGPTGGGKTTITNLLFRFYEPQKGKIFLDGIEIGSIPVDILRKKLGLVLQDIILFPGTVLDNLRLDNQEISEEKVLCALKSVDAEDMVEKLPEGLKTPLSEYGKNLSMGERQLLSFARAMVFDPEILVLDEATSSIDPVTEKKIQKATKSLLSGRTSIIIAHRLETILECDKIIVIKDGHVLEEGNHKELIEKKGLYRELYEIQTGQQESVC